MPVKLILVIDDSPTDRLLMQRALESGGYQVITAENGEAGFLKCKASQPDLVLMDIVLPGGLNGFQATRMLTRDEATKHIPIIICTTKAEETDRLWGMRQGAYAYLTKPVDTAELLAKIQALG
jgi:twitching motility two-component system response regulator PilH